MPARRKRKSIRPKRKKIKKKYIYLVFLFAVFFVGLTLVLRAGRWNGKDKLSLVVKNDDYSLSVVVLDPVLEEIYKFKIPASTEIEVAGGYGTWKVKSLWDLGEQEGLGGKLVARSITMGLKLPVYAWADKQALGLIEPGLKSFFRALFTSYKSNLIFGDKLRILVFSMKVKNTKRVSVDLGETSFLEKGVLSDGQEGFKNSQEPPQNIAAVFSEPLYSTGIVRVSIKDATEKTGLAKKVSSIFGILGGKVSSIETFSGFEGVCLIRSKNQQLLDILKKIFECEEYLVISDQPIDIEITLGKNFAKVY